MQLLSLIKNLPCVGWCGAHWAPVCFCTGAFAPNMDGAEWDALIFNVSRLTNPTQPFALALVLSRVPTLEPANSAKLW